MASLIDKFFVWWGDPTAYQTEQTVNSSLLAEAQRRYSVGIYSLDQYNDYVKKIGGATIDRAIDDAAFNGLGLSPSQTFTGSVVDSAKALPNTISSFINNTLAGTANTLFKSLPWQIWALALIVLLVYLLPLFRGLKGIQK